MDSWSDGDTRLLDAILFAVRTLKKIYANGLSENLVQQVREMTARSETLTPRERQILIELARFEADRSLDQLRLEMTVASLQEVCPDLVV